MWDLSSPTRDWTHTPCIRVWSCKHWITREVLRQVSSNLRMRHKGFHLSLGIPQMCSGFCRWLWNSQKPKSFECIFIFLKQSMQYQKVLWGSQGDGEPSQIWQIPPCLSRHIWWTNSHNSFISTNTQQAPSSVRWPPPCRQESGRALARQGLGCGLGGRWSSECVNNSVCEK